jgi:predicted ATPase/DNA-binding XRE family transcriptional regulator
MAEGNPQSYIRFGSLLRYLRQRARLTQDEFGLAVGYSRAHIARLESDQRMPDPAIVQARFVEALRLCDEPTWVARLLELAGAAHDRAVAGSTVESPLNIPNNLPMQINSFIGREKELATLERVLAGLRLLTLTGAGGTGKTRLALELATRLSGDPNLVVFSDGIWFVELAALTDPAFVPQAVASVLGVYESPGNPLLPALAGMLKDKRLLLILDNCEHLIETCAALADCVLRHTHAVCILATSREALGISGELAWRVPPLQTPHSSQQITPTTLERYEAVRLFIERANLALPGFMLTEDNAQAVRDICTRLDGIPLAIELAAARMSALSVQEINARLNNRFHLLAGGSRAVLPRHRTLRALIDWSYQLLNEPERVLLRRLSVFVGGWTLDAAEAVCAGEEIDASQVLDLLIRLVDKSFIMVDESGTTTRYALLETIRQYALEKLADAQEDTLLHERHLECYLRMGEGVMRMIRKAPAKQVSLLQCLASELDNVRHGLKWAAEVGRIDDGLRLAHTWFDVFVIRAGQAEVLARMESLLAQSTVKHTRTQALALIDIADIHERQAEFEQALCTLHRAQEIGLELDDPQVLSLVYYWLAICAQLRGDYDLARSHIRRWRAYAIAGHLFDDASIQAEESFLMGAVALYEEDYPSARRLFARAYELTLEADKLSTTAVSRYLGYALTYVGDFTEAAARLRESLVDNFAIGDMQAVAASLGAYGVLALVSHDLRRAARLFGASEMLGESIHIPLMTSDTDQIRHAVAALRTQLDEKALRSEWAIGQAMPLEQAIAYAVGEPHA